MAQWDDIKKYMDGVAYMVDLIKSKNDLSGTYVSGTDSPRFGWGTDGTRAGTISESAAGIYTLLDALGAHPEIQTDLVPIFGILKESTKAAHIYRRFYHFAKGQDRVIGAKIYIEANDERLSENLQDVLGYLLPANVFMEQPTIDALGTLATLDYLTITTLTYTDGAEVDTDSYGKHNIYIENTGKTWGVGDTIFRLTMTKLDGSSETQDVTMPGGSAVGVKVDVGTHDSDMYIGVSAAEIVAPDVWEATDQIEIYCEEERDVQASWWTP